MFPNRFQFERLAENHWPLLCDWLNRPHIAERWGGPVSEAEVRSKYSARIQSTSVSCYIAVFDGVPAGFIQSYVAAEGTDGWWPDEHDPGVIGIDQFVADADNLGRGVGTLMVSEFVRHLFQNFAVTKIQADPAPDNLRAIRCYEKCGFRKADVIETPNGPAILMTIDRETPEV